MARSTRNTRTSSARKGSTAKSRTAARPTQPAWRQSVEQIVTLGKGAAEFVQRHGGSVISEAQRRSSALTLQARQAAEERLEAVAVKVVGQWDQVEQAASARVGRTLNRLGVPSQKDIDKLTRSVAKLSAQIDKLSAAAPKAPRSRRAAASAAEAS